MFHRGITCPSCYPMLQHTSYNKPEWQPRMKIPIHAGDFFVVCFLIHLFAKREFNEKMDALFAKVCYNVMSNPSVSLNLILFVYVESNEYSYF